MAEKLMLTNKEKAELEAGLGRYKSNNSNHVWYCKRISGSFLEYGYEGTYSLNQTDDGYQVLRNIRSAKSEGYHPVIPWDNHWPEHEIENNQNKLLEWLRS